MQSKSKCAQPCASNDATVISTGTTKHSMFKCFLLNQCSAKHMIPKWPFALLAQHKEMVYHITVLSKSIIYIISSHRINTSILECYFCIYLVHTCTTFNRHYNYVQEYFIKINLLKLSLSVCDNPTPTHMTGHTTGTYYLGLLLGPYTKD